MPKATLTITTAVPVTTPVLPSASRRRLLAGSGVATLATAFALPMAVSPAHAAPVDPVLAIYAKWRALEDAGAIMDKQHDELRADFVRLYGESWKDGGGAWKNDPRNSELAALTAQCNDLNDQSTDLLDVMTETPATSLEGVRCKLLATIHVLKFIEKPNAEAEYHDIMALAVMRDAVRLLGGSAAA